MALPENLIKEFAAALTTKQRTPSENTVYGVVSSIEDGIANVVLDGSDTETPASCAMMVEAGDKVTVMIKNRKAVVTGNLTSPASAQAGNMYMRFTEAGLKIGLVDGDGIYILITNDRYLLKDAEDNTLASFSANETSLNGGKGIVRVVQDILFLLGEGAVGLRSNYSDETDIYQSEVVVKATDTSPAASIQLTKRDIVSGLVEVLASILLSSDESINVVAKNGFYVNGIAPLYPNKLLLTSKLVLDGTATAKKLTNFNGVIELLSEEKYKGYRLVGIREILIIRYDTRKRSVYLNLNQFWCNPSSNTVGALVHNTSSVDIETTVAIEWFALNIGSATTDVDDVIIDLGVDSIPDIDPSTMFTLTVVGGNAELDGYETSTTDGTTTGTFPVYSVVKITPSDDLDGNFNEWAITSGTPEFVNDTTAGSAEAYIRIMSDVTLEAVYAEIYTLSIGLMTAGTLEADGYSPTIYSLFGDVYDPTKPTTNKNNPFTEKLIVPKNAVVKVATNPDYPTQETNFVRWDSDTGNLNDKVTWMNGTNRWSNPAYFKASDDFTMSFRPKYDASGYAYTGFFTEDTDFDKTYRVWFSYVGSWTDTTVYLGDLSFDHTHDADPVQEYKDSYTLDADTDDHICNRFFTVPRNSIVCILSHNSAHSKFEVSGKTQVTLSDGKTIATIDSTSSHAEFVLGTEEGMTTRDSNGYLVAFIKVKGDVHLTIS